MRPIWCWPDILAPASLSIIHTSCPQVNQWQSFPLLALVLPLFKTHITRGLAGDTIFPYVPGCDMQWCFTRYAWTVVGIQQVGFNWCKFLILLVESWRIVIISGTVHWFWLKTSFHPLLWTSSGLTGSWKLSAYIRFGSLRSVKSVKTRGNWKPKKCWKC